MAEPTVQGTTTSPVLETEEKVEGGQSIASAAEAITEEVVEEGEEGAEQPEKKEKKNDIFSELISQKRENRDLKRMIKDEVIPTIKALQEQLRGGERVEKDELDQLAEKYGLEGEFVKELASAVSSKTAKAVEDKYLPEIETLRTEAQETKNSITKAQLATAIKEQFERVVQENPEYAKIANPEAVKKYILSDKANLKRSMEDIMDEMYGGSGTRESGAEGYAGQGSNHQKKIDYGNPNMDEETLKRITQSRLKKGPEYEKYSENLLERLQGRI